MIPSIDLPVLTRIFFPYAEQFLVLSDQPLSGLPTQFRTFQNWSQLLTTLETVRERVAIVNLTRSVRSLPTMKYLLGQLVTSSQKEGEQYHMINNPDGSVRWLEPVQQRSARFLDLYNANGWKGRLFSQAARIALRLGLGRRLFPETLTVEGVPFMAETDQQTEFAIFTGTRGANRKAVLSIRQDGEQWFRKIPLTRPASELVRQERAVLTQLGKHEWNRLHIPALRALSYGVEVSNVQPACFQNSTEWTEVHAEGLQELYARTGRLAILDNLTAWQEMAATLDQLPGRAVHPAMKADQVERIIGHLQRLFHSIDPSRVWPVGLAHGDFTPWNMYIAPGRLHVYDWELATEAPFLYDAFHYQLQTGILVHRYSGQELLRQLLRFKREPWAERITEEYGVRIETLLHFYLLRQVSYYLDHYLQQEQLHEQVHWQLQAWEEVLALL